MPEEDAACDFGRPSLLAIVAQPLEVEDGHATIFQPQEPLLLQPLQALVGVLPGDAGERPDFLLSDFEVAREIGIENGIEQGGDRTRQTRGRIQRAAVFEQPNELAKPLVELPDQEAIEANAVLEQPDESS